MGVDGHAVRQVPGVMLGLWLPLLADLDRPFVTEQALAELKAMSAATVDRDTGEMRSRDPVTGVENLDDLISQRQPAAVMGFGPDDVDMGGIEVDLTGPQGTGLAGPQPA